MVEDYLKTLDCPVNIDMIGNQAYHLDLRQQLCLSQKSCPGCGRPSCIGDDLHHLLIRRISKFSELLWHPLNISLVCHTCHVPERKNLGYSATIQKFRAGITPEQIEGWVASLPTKVPLNLPAFYHLAKEHHQEFISKEEYPGR